MTSFCRISDLQRCLFLVVFAPLLSQSARAQLEPSPMVNSVNDLTQTPAPGSGHDYQHLLGETVNFSNGSVSFKISFPTPGGRGISLPYAWSYNSAAVNTLDSDGVQQSWNNPGFPHSTFDGWNLSDGLPGASVQVFSQLPSGPTPPNETAVPCNSESGITFTDMAGVTHNLGIGARVAASTGTGDYYQCAASLILPPLGDAQVIGIVSPETGAGLASNQPTSGPFLVEDKSGTIYSFVLAASGNGGNSMGPAGLVEDRNGNYITIPGANGALWTDSAGRSGPILSSGPNARSVTTEGELYSSTWGTVNVSYTIARAGGAAGFGCYTIPTAVSGTKNVLSTLTLPDGGEYQFFYNNSYGLLSEIIFPDGGWIQYTYQLAPGYNEQLSVAGFLNQVPQNFGCTWQYQTPMLAQRTVSFDGINAAQTQNFQYQTAWQYDSNGYPTGWTSKTTTVTTVDNKRNNLTSKTVYLYSPYFVPLQPFATSGIANAIPQENTITYYDWGNPPTQKLKMVTKSWYDQLTEASETTTLYSSNNPVLTAETAYNYTSGLCTSVTFAPLKYITEQDDYGFGSGTSPGPIIKRTKYNYKCFTPSNPSTYSDYFPGNAPSSWANYQGIVVPPKLFSVVVEDGGNNILTATQYNYDETGLSSSLPTQYDDTGYSTVTARGNLTSILRCNPLPTSQPQQPTSSSPICSAGPKTTYTYDSAGQPHAMTDPKGNQTQFSFADNFTDTSSAPTTDAYLTKITYPNGLYATYQYNYRLGYLTTSTDLNLGNKTTYKYGTQPSGCSYSDSLDRPTEVDYPDGGITTNCY